MLEYAVECVAVRGDLGASSAIIRGTALSTTWKSCRLRVTLCCCHSWSPEHSAVHGRWVQYGHLECLDRELSGMISSLWTAAGTVPNSLAAASSDLDAYLPPSIISGARLGVQTTRGPLVDPPVDDVVSSGFNFSMQATRCRRSSRDAQNSRYLHSRGGQA